MSNLMARGLANLNARVESAAGVSVLYSRARTSQSATIPAVPGRPRTVTTTADGVRVEYGERDYLILAADLVLGGEAVEPEDGDRITETIDGVVSVFKLTPTDGGEPSWGWSGSDRKKYRVHVKRVG